jgi:para-aminobenzoate synthetase component 1
MESFRLKIDNPEAFKRSALVWASHFPVFAYFDSNAFLKDRYGQYDMLLAVDQVRDIRAEAGKAINSLKDFHHDKPSWLFGTLGYDLKNEIEALESVHQSLISFPDLYFFEPRYLLLLEGNQLTINRRPIEGMALLDAIQSIRSFPQPNHEISLRPELSKEEYLDRMQQIRQHILEGDFYEINFCQQFTAKGHIDPIATFFSLNKMGEAPFSACFKYEEKFVLSSSPERYLKKQGRKLISQPIKGTAARDVDPYKDRKLLKDLMHSEKEQAENVMIVDLVRNDLRRVSKTGTVKVEELFGAYSFKQVHQIVSTISAEMQDGLHWTEAIRASFPMGSMTGAPKVEVMKRTEALECFRRNWYSGAMGYINPEGDFDFNVLIRSIFYDNEQEQISVPVGGAITFDSEPEAEYKECLLKAEAMRQVLEGQTLRQ